MRGKDTLRRKEEEEEHLQMYGESTDGKVGYHLHGPVDSEKRMSYSGQETWTCKKKRRGIPFVEWRAKWIEELRLDQATESRAHIRSQNVIYTRTNATCKMGEMWRVSKPIMESFDISGNREKTTAIMGDKWGLQTAKQDGDDICK